MSDKVSDSSSSYIYFANNLKELKSAVENLEKVVTFFQDSYTKALSENLQFESLELAHADACFESNAPSLIGAAWTELEDAYNSLFDISLDRNVHNPASKDEASTERISAPFSVEAKYDGVNIYIKLPLLPSKQTSENKKRMKLSDGKTVFMTTSQYTSIFASQVRNEVQKVILDDLQNDVSQFCRKTIHYYFVYSKKDKSYAVDADNVDTKRVTDAILGLFPGGDSAGLCQFHFSSFFSDVIPTGTYVIVQPNEKIEVPDEAKTAFSLFSKTKKT